MAKRCVVCGLDTIFYVWSTSRNFPRENLILKKDYKSKHEKGRVSVEGLPVCFKCFKELKKM